MKKNKNIFQQKGFYFALYSVVIGMALLAFAKQKEYAAGNYQNNKNE